MAEHSKIEWTDATWNPITGCSVTSPGCTNCYAMKLAGTRLKHHPSRSGLTQDSKAGPVWTGEVRLNKEWLTQPLRWKRPRMIFVCAHGDLFHEAVPDGWIDRVFAVMALSPQHTFQVLTKRSKRMREYLHKAKGRVGWIVFTNLMRWKDLNPPLKAEAWRHNDDRPWPLHNVWLGVSVEDQARANERIPDLLATPAAVRWVSAEPLLGPVDLHDITVPDECPGEQHISALYCEEDEENVGDEPWGTDTIDWVVGSGESGPGARPMHPDWARSLRDQCAAAGVPFFFKQIGEWAWPGDEFTDLPVWRRFGRNETDPANVHVFHDGLNVGRVGKSRAGRLLDGVEHNAMPEVRK